MTEPRRWTTRRVFVASLALYAVSFVLPAILNPDPTSSFGWVDTWGWEAAVLSFATPMVVILGPSNLGYAAAALLIPFGFCRVAVVCSLVALLSMAYCGFMVPSHPGGGPIRWPGGHLGPGYYAWLAAGIMMLVCAVRASREAQDAEAPTLGLRPPPPASQ
jgi:hypothetical protein